MAFDDRPRLMLLKAVDDDVGRLEDDIAYECVGARILEIRVDDRCHVTMDSGA